MIFVQYVFPSLSLSISFASSSIFQRARFSKMENWVLFCIVRVLARHTAAAAEEKNFGSRINAACCWCLCIIICNLLSGKCFHHILFKYNTNIYLKLYLELNWMMKKLPWLVRITSHSSAPIWPLFVLLKLHSRQSAYAHVQSIILKSTWTWSNVFFWSRSEYRIRAPKLKRLLTNNKVDMTKSEAVCFCVATMFRIRMYAAALDY